MCRAAAPDRQEKHFPFSFPLSHTHILPLRQGWHAVALRLNPLAALKLRMVFTPVNFFKSQEYFMKCEKYIAFKFQCPLIKFY